jgi:uncharacterized protein YjhX (UPF0386 family)
MIEVDKVGKTGLSTIELVKMLMEVSFDLLQKLRFYQELQQSIGQPWRIHQASLN